MKKEQRMKNVNNPQQSRGEGIDVSFLDAYSEEKTKKRVLPPLEPLCKEDFIINEEIPYIVSCLKELNNSTIPLEESNEDELGEETNCMKVSSIEERSENQVKLFLL